MKKLKIINLKNVDLNKNYILNIEKYDGLFGGDNFEMFMGSGEEIINKIKEDEFVYNFDEDVEISREEYDKIFIENFDSYNDGGDNYFIFEKIEVERFN